MNPSEIIKVAQAEGVVALLHAQLQRPEWAGAISPALTELIATAVQEKAVQSMLREVECRRILARLEREALCGLLLKGSALAFWLYPSPHLRECSDIDFLFASQEAATRASLAMCEGDYVQPGIAGNLATYEMTCYRTKGATGYLELDLHWGIGGSPVFAECFQFEELIASSQPLPFLGAKARGLGPVHAYLHATMHRALQLWQGSGNRLKWLYDLHLMGQTFTDREWDLLVSISLERGLCGTCLDGLLASAETFHTEVPKDLVAHLAQGAQKESLDVRRMQNWAYLQWMNLRALPTLSLKARWLWQRLFPSTEFLHHYYGQDGQGRGALTRYLKKGLRNLRG